MIRIMQKSVWVLSYVIFALSLSTCGGNSDGYSPRDYSGIYYVHIGQNPPWTMAIKQSGSNVTFTMEDKGQSVAGTGTISGSNMTLTVEVPWALTILATFSDDGENFTGSFDVTGDNPIQGSIAGTKSAWATYDGNVNSLPQFIARQPVELDKIHEISRFRSGKGHDYSDDFESCRSMKHYFLPKINVPYKTVKLFSPVDGTITGTAEEWDGTLWKGTAVGIKPDGYDAFHLVIFHINLVTPLKLGDKVTAGQELGLSEKASGTVSDFAVGVNTPLGYKLVSYFEVMADTLFDEYKARGMTTRAEAIISKDERDLDPLTCNGEIFANAGNLVNRVTFN